MLFLCLKISKQEIGAKRSFPYISSKKKTQVLCDLKYKILTLIVILYFGKFWVQTSRR